MARARRNVRVGGISRTLFVAVLRDGSGNDAALRRQKTRSQHFDAAADVTRVAATNQSHETLLTQQETRNEIEHALTHLTDKQRTALVLMVTEGLSAADVYQRVSEARKSLRNAPALRQLWQDHR